MINLSTRSIYQLPSVQGQLIKYLKLKIKNHVYMYLAKGRNALNPIPQTFKHSQHALICILVKYGTDY